MTRAAALLAVLACPVAARADVGFSPLPQRHVPVRVTLAVAAEPPGVATVVLDGRHGAVYRVRAGEALELAYPAGERFTEFTVYAVRAADLARFPGGVPDRDWLRAKENVIGQAAETNYRRGQLDSLDRRELVTVNYRVEPLADGVKLVPASSNDPPPLAPCCAVGVLAPVALIWLGLWVRRRRRTG